MLRGGCHGLPLLILHQMEPITGFDHEVEGAIHTSEVAVNGDRWDDETVGKTAPSLASNPVSKVSHRNHTYQRSQPSRF